MKRELKAMVIVPLLDIELPIARLIPMKRELKDMEQARAASLIQIARLIPMKRELKVLQGLAPRGHL